MERWSLALGALLGVLGVLAACLAANGTLRREVHPVPAGPRPLSPPPLDQGQVVAAVALLTPHDVEIDPEVGIVIANGSGAAVFDIEVESTDGFGHPREVLQVRALPPGTFFVPVGPLGDWGQPEAVGLCPGAVREMTRPEHWRVTELLFTDTRGRRWSRRPTEASSSLLRGPAG